MKAAMGSESSVATRVIEMLNEGFGYECGYSSEILDNPLTGPPYELNGFELYRLLMLIEEEFGIYFHPNDVRQIGFFTLNNVVSLISNANSMRCTCT